MRKKTDRDGLYAVMSDGGTISFRYDYRINGRRETLTIGRYDETRARDVVRDLGSLEYGGALSLAEARVLLTKARPCAGLSFVPLISLVGRILSTSLYKEL